MKKKLKMTLKKEERNENEGKAIDENKRKMKMYERKS